MKIAIAQLNYTVGDIENNKLKIIDGIYKARELGAGLAVFSEYAISGTPAYDFFGKMPFIEACEEALVEIASYCDNISVLVGVPLHNKNRIGSSAAFIQNRQVISYIGKQNVSSRSELGFIHPSKSNQLIKIGDNKIAVVVGEDISTFDDCGRHADTVVCLRAEPYARAIIAKRFSFAAGLAFSTGKNVVSVNYLGGQGEDVYDGSSFAFNSSGKAMAILKSFEEELTVIDTVSSPEVTVPEQDKTRNVYRAIKLGLGDYLSKNGFGKACVGLSGGIDSAVVFAMAVEVLGKDNVRALLMPSEFSTEHSVADAVQLADNLGAGYDIIPITETYKTVVESLEPIFRDTGFDVAEENIQARIRGMLLMAYSNKFGHIVLNTGNKSETAVGYSTLYGDMVGAISILGDLYKTEVYDLARFINRHGEIIPESIISKEPSAELRHGQRDTDTLPVYDTLDAILYRFIEEGQSPEEIVSAGFDNALVRKVIDQVIGSEYKRRQDCPVLRLSDRPFGKGFVLPLLNKFVL